MIDVKIHQEYLKKMLEKILNIFKENNIKYFLIGGTLLGAIRHSGFIPWDDDIDIGMLREDYDRFIKLSKDILPSYYSFKSRENDEKYNYFFGKIYDERTTLIEKTKKRIIGGIYIDIFPFDKIDDDNDAATLRLKKVSKLRKLYNFKTGYFNVLKDTKLIKIIRPFVIPFLSAKRIEKKIWKEVYSNKTAPKKNFANFFGAWAERELVSFDSINETIITDFEGMDVVIPKGYDEILIKLYGKYMELPSEDKRKSHHNIEYISYDISYLKNKERSV